MHEIILLGISIVSITLLWRFGARQTYLDEARDALFDLRDQKLRPFFLHRENGLHDPLYLRLRNLINGHLRHTENFSFVSYISLMVLLRSCKDQIERGHSRHEQAFSSSDPEVQKMSDTIRKQSAEIMLIYMVKSSLFARLLMFVALNVLLFNQIRKHLHQIFDVRNYQNYMKIVAVVALTVIPMRIVPGLPMNATISAIESRAFEA